MTVSGRAGLATAAALAVVTAGVLTTPEAPPDGTYAHRIVGKFHNGPDEPWVLVFDGDYGVAVAEADWRELGIGDRIAVYTPIADDGTQQVVKLR